MENPDKAEGRKMLVTEGSPSETVLEPAPSTNTHTNTQIQIQIVIQKLSLHSKMLVPERSHRFIMEIYFEISEVLYIGPVFDIDVKYLEMPLLGNLADIA